MKLTSEFEFANKTVLNFSTALYTIVAPLRYNKMETI